MELYETAKEYVEAYGGTKEIFKEAELKSLIEEEFVKKLPPELQNEINKEVIGNSQKKLQKIFDMMNKL